MSLILNSEQAMLRDSAQAFLSDAAPVAHLRALRDARDDAGYSREVWQRFAGLGFAGVLVPEEHGGLQLGQTEVGVLMEAIGRNLSPLPFLSTAVLGAVTLARGASAELAARLLPAIAGGEVIVALAVDEHEKHRPARIALTARPEGEGWVLDGHKNLVVDGHCADVLIVVARTAGGLTLFALDRETPGLGVERTVMVDAHNAARLTLAGVRVGAAAVIGPVDGGAALLETVLDIGRVALAAELLGLADETFARTLQYLKDRQQFGKIIGEFQALQHRAADLQVELEVTRGVVMKAQEALDAGSPQAALLASAAKARASATASRAVQEGVQMHGGMGMTDACDIGLFMKRARVAGELLGDEAFHLDRFARLRAY